MDLCKRNDWSNRRGLVLLHWVGLVEIIFLEKYGRLAFQEANMGIYIIKGTSCIQANIEAYAVMAHGRFEAVG